MARKNRIQFAWLLQGWDFTKRDVNDLVNRGEGIPPDEYLPEMKDNIFCPECFTPLSRSPADKQAFSNTNGARYNHRPSFISVKCSLRAPKPETVAFGSEELARQAISDQRLVVIHDFRSDAPSIAADLRDQAGITMSEDVEGPVSDYVISRHKGESFELPTVISTVAGICRRFDKNLHKHYLFPSRQSPTMLVDELIDIRTVTQPDDKPKLYFGKISKFDIREGSDQYLMMTYLRFNGSYKDFCLKAPRREQAEKGITEDSRDRYVIFWGAITVSGVGLSVNRPKWGEYALLPEIYENLLPLASQQ